MRYERVKDVVRLAVRLQAAAGGLTLEGGAGRIDRGKAAGGSTTARGGPFPATEHRAAPHPISAAIQDPLPGDRLLGPARLIRT